MARCARVEDCPSLDGLGVGGDCLEEHRCCKSIVMGGGREAVVKSNIVVRFTATDTRPYPSELSKLLERRERKLVRLLLLGHLLLRCHRDLRILPDVIHHCGALLGRGHCHGHPLPVLPRRWLPRSILCGVVGDCRQMLLLLLLAGGRWGTAGCRR